MVIEDKTYVFIRYERSFFLFLLLFHFVVLYCLVCASIYQSTYQTRIFHSIKRILHKGSNFRFIFAFSLLLQ